MKRRRSLGAQVPHPARLGEPNEYANLAVPIVENAMLTGGPSVSTARSAWRRGNNKLCRRPRLVRDCALER